MANLKPGDKTVPFELPGVDDQRPALEDYADKEALIEAMDQALAAVSTQDVRGCFVPCGYRTPAQQLLKAL
jgi:hypothetical protein